MSCIGMGLYADKVHLVKEQVLPKVKICKIINSYSLRSQPGDPCRTTLRMYCIDPKVLVFMSNNYRQLIWQTCHVDEQSLTVQCHHSWSQSVRPITCYFKQRLTSGATYRKVSPGASYKSGYVCLQYTLNYSLHIVSQGIYEFS